MVHKNTTPVERPKILPVNPDGIPASLRQIAQWVCWRLVLREGKWTKMPISPHGGSAKSTDPATWGTFDEALAAYQSGRLDGIGFVFSADDDFAGVDFDHCYDGERFTEWTFDVLTPFRTYCEYSPSGTGLHSIMLGAKPGPKCKRTGYPDGGAVEVYDRERFLCITGHRLPDFPADVQDCQQQLEALYHQLFPEQQHNKPHSNGQHSKKHVFSATADDNVIISKITSRAPYDSLWAGDVSQHDNDDSRADLALCSRIAFFTGADPARIDSIFRQSGLYRQKWERADYRERTIDAAVRGCRDFYQWSGRGEKQEAEKPAAVERFTLAELREQYPTLNPPVVEGLFREAESVNIISVSKVGKSWLAYDLALSVITGSPWLGRFHTSPGKVLLIDNELHRGTLSNRIPAVGDALHLPRADYEHKLEIWPLRGNLRSIGELDAEFERIRPGTFKLVILDAKYRFATAGVSENDNAAEALCYNLVDRYAERLGAAFALIHHSSKGDQSDKRVTDVGSGAGSQSRAADCHLILREHEDPGAVVLDAAVRSFAPVEPITLRWEFPIWTPAPDLDPANLKRRKTIGDEKQEQRDREGKRDIINVLRDGPQTIRKLPGLAGMSRDRCERLLAQLHKSGDVAAEEIEVKGNETTLYTLTDHD